MFADDVRQSSEEFSRGLVPTTAVKARKLHKYLGIPLSVLLLLASASGILLNHRELLQQADLPRSILPSSYRYKHWNNGAIKGALQTPRGLILYGGVGLWRTDSTLRSPVQPFSTGIATGADEQRIIALTQAHSGELWAASQFRLYRLAPTSLRWREAALPASFHGRIADLILRGDSLILLGRSKLYLARCSQGAKSWQEVQLATPPDYTGKLLLFRIVWALHSGEYFGLAGRLFVDLLGIILILLALTGIFYTFIHKHLTARKEKRSREKRSAREAQLLSRLFKWHLWIGRGLFYPLLFVVISGWFLRPPLMLPLIFSKVRPLPFSDLASDNPWFDRLRTLRYDEQNRCWLLYSSEGFYMLDSLMAVPQRWHYQPPVSPMGVNVLEHRKDGSWLVGSFSGLYEVNPKGREAIRNYITQAPVSPSKMSRPVSNTPVAGYITTGDQQREYVSDYGRGMMALDREKTDLTEAREFPSQPHSLDRATMSLWQVALELHTGRLYAPFIGKWGVDLFIFLLGLLSTIVFISGIRGRRRRKRPNRKETTTKIC